MKICTIENCNKKHLAKGYCVKHYQKFKKYGDSEGKYIKKITKCSILECNNKTVGRGYCNKHYGRWRKYKDPNKTLINVNPPELCKVEGCNKKHMALGFCHNHYMINYMFNRRIEVIYYYSNGTITCACCEESEFKFLDIDHINNNGAEHRRAGIDGGNDMIAWLINNNFPEGYQVLCSNCNVGKWRNGGICPHKELK